MKTNRLLIGAVIFLAAAVLAIVPWGPPPQAQGRSGDQQMARMRFVSDGVQTQAAGVLQSGELNTLSAAVASNTTAQVVAAPTAGSIYLRGIWIEKMTTATGLVNVIYGTGTNCGTGTTTLLSLSLATGQAPLFGKYVIGVAVPATKALCLQTDASTTSVRALYN